jgi:GNAT superfamily N-acetyltransferase
VPLASLSSLLSKASRGLPPAPDGTLTIIGPPDSRSVGVFAFTAHHVISAPVDPDWVRSVLSADDLSAPLNPPFLSALATRAGLVINNLDAVLVAGAAPVDLDLRPAADLDHGRVALARFHRVDVRVWTVAGGILTLGRGVAGRWEVSVEVDDAAQGRGLGRRLFAAARGLTGGEPVWAQVAPGNAASLRALLAAGFRPVGAEVLLVGNAT